MRFNPKLSMNKSSFTTLDSVKEGFVAQQGMFRAKTDSYFANTRVISDKVSIAYISVSAENFGQILIKFWINFHSNSK
jgi:hypothetical protein